MTAITWKIEIDWTATGAYVDESDRLLDLSISRGRETAIDGNGFTNVEPGSISFLLDNWDQRYNPYNTTGALYGYIKPHRRFRVRAEYESVTYSVLTGWIRDIRPQEQRATVRLTGMDGIDWLDAINSPMLGLQTDYAVTDAIVALLNAAAWPFADVSGWILGTSQLGIDNYLGSSAIESSGDIIPYWWGDPEKTVWEAICELANAFAGNPFVANDGTFSYRSRWYTSPIVLDMDEGEILKDIELTQPWDEIRNDVRITGYPRQETAANTELWKLNTIPAIGAGQSITFWTDFTYDSSPVPALSITTPAATTDFTANSLADGLGTDKTAQIGIVITIYATTAKMVVTNNDVAEVFLTLLRLRGTGIYNVSPTAVIETDAASIADYGKQSLNFHSIWLQTVDAITNRAGYTLAVFADPRKILYIRLIGRYEDQLILDLFDKISVTIPKLEIEDEYILTYISHAWNAGSYLETTFRLEPGLTSTAGFWILGSGALGTTTVLGW